MNHALLLTNATYATFRTKTLATGAAIAAAVALPQLLHAAGAAAGLGTALGQTWLPMHLPVLLVGLLAGPLAGLIAGAFSPLLSFSLSGMPLAAMLPFMMFELAGYGLIAGLLGRNPRLPVLGKILLAQLGGRALCAGAILVAFYGLGSQTVAVNAVWNNAVLGWPGILLQWCLLPLVILWVQKRDKGYE